MREQRDVDRDDSAIDLYRRAEMHELAAERFFVLGDAINGERERILAMSFWQEAQRREHVEWSSTEAGTDSIRTTAGPQGAAK